MSYEDFRPVYGGSLIQLQKLSCALRLARMTEAIAVLLLMFD